MRWRALVVAATAGLLVLVSAGPAMAKGADRATISGPGLASPIVVGAGDDGSGGGGSGDGGSGEPGSGGSLATLADGSGLFLAMFGADGGRRLTEPQPAGPLGPRYELTYRVPDGSPGPATVTQDLYPAAAGGPVTFTRAGQQVFGSTTAGGWYRAPASFAALLGKLGVPGVTAPTTAPTTAPAAGAPPSLQPRAADGASAPGGSRPVGYWVAAGAGVLLVFALASAVLYRRRVTHGRAGAAAR
jgi:hypothetical protein